MQKKLLGFYKPIVLIVCLNVIGIIGAKSEPNKITEGYIYLNIFFMEAVPGDTLTISVGENMLATLKGTSFGDKKSEFKSVQNDKGYFGFKIPVFQSSGYFDLKKNRVLGEVAFNKSVAILEPQFWEVNDSLNIRLSFKETRLGLGATAEFKGRGADKYSLIDQCKRLTLTAKQIKVSELWPDGWNGNILQYHQYDATPTITLAKLHLLEEYKGKLTIESYNVIKANFIYSGKSVHFSRISAFVSSGQFSKLDLKSQDSIITRFNQSYDFEHNYGINEKYLAKSINFLHFLNYKLQTASRLNTGKYSPGWIYSKAKNSYINPVLKEVILMMFLTGFRLAENPSIYYADAKTIIRNPSYLLLLQQLEARSPGKQFTDFNLESINGTFKSLIDFKNKVVLIDFWYTGCGYCQDYYKNTLSKVEKKFRDNPNVIFLSISIDRDKSVWRGSVEKGVYTSQNVENVYTNGLRALHPIITSNNIFGYPCVILLDKDSRIKFFNSNNLYQVDTLTNSINELL